MTEPVRITVFVPQLRQASTVMVPMACKTRFTTPAARSAGAASSARLPKLAAVISGSSVVAWSVVMSAMRRSTRLSEPLPASFLIWQNRSTPTSLWHSPPSVPPPMPLPHRCSTFPPLAQRKAVPVPMVTTTPSGWPDRASAPVPLALNSETRRVGRL